MTIQEHNQTSLTDELYSKDIAIAEFHKKLTAIEARVHFARTTITSAIDQYRNSNHLYEALSDEKKELTSMLDWMSDLLFYMGEASEDVKTRSLDSYKELRDADNLGSYDSKVYLKDLTKEISRFRGELLELSGGYWKWVLEVKPCSSIFEILVDEVAKEAAKKTKAINFYDYG